MDINSKKTKLKIVHVLPFYDPVIGGMEELAKAKLVLTEERIKASLKGGKA